MIQERITRWANRVFGRVTTIARAAARANEEMAELIVACCKYDAIVRSPSATAWDRDAARTAVAKEASDVQICLYRLCSELVDGRGMGIALDWEVEVKHLVNLERKWHPDGTGHGYHCKGPGQCKHCGESDPVQAGDEP